MTRPLTLRQACLLEALGGGPRSVPELDRSCGLAADKHGQDYVHKTLGRLAGHYPVYRLGTPHSHRGCLYLLLPPTRQEGPLCSRCGRPVASDHRGDLLCSPCQRALVDEELAAAATS